ncbi:hypothetical protein KHS38_15455 [Mucilaginibacter sp. Bleaf8]|uniref:hypothetical protein n=1 Tax=Mucilaginibacter sp. Bleaf8 TaxID=2834430 RepID=UPI001BCE8012|nr:hypothetical protein [Mucilaginibacter sp. Bleaf8]MBS7565803.1 hypothetical protein [Mucilaginibacter sp. Bleaf8]
MAPTLYSPFNRMNFSNRNCFLTGEALSSEEEKIQVFPAWLMSRYNLADQPFKLLDESYTTYKDLKLPCAATTNNQYISPLEAAVEQAFTQGYEAVKALDPLLLFQWAGKLLYGIIFNEIQAGIRQQHAQGESFTISQALSHKFSHLHLMLQSLNLPLIFDEFMPYSVFVYKVNNAENDFGYRDEINTLTFSLRLNDFGIIICLQDNGANGRYHRDLYEQWQNRTLHPIQFEEMNARVFYSAFLFNKLPEYSVLPVGNDIYLEAMSLRGTGGKPTFDFWQNKTYGQVLENFWKKWGFVLFEIIKNPEEPMSYLFKPDGSIMEPEEIDLPL